MVFLKNQYAENRISEVIYDSETLYESFFRLPFIEK